ncbi:PorP/SprF family type IX secretion system membrane protein [Parapedobacter indicus]|uniref:Type IX secretion system membrane protein, PorP/SprF family n=1 Tax=Parapedobacter indicus TaxID=1477437 RepID=A0A1I3S2C8_9SPHI|nr:type IX secretion system membrane protein PorP/SprF [Parapedobacter indicus]PPK99878.1 type IX secretion system PorP/SprF family membrane protein [Parapedobacter indicus]SFJ53023.1 type IX secretion system membrane protein, PorP/SprF family [Parapedobacter indicus]
MKKYYFLVLIALSTAPALAQQVVQYSQYMFNGLYINPAYAGYRGPVNLHTYYRSQWTGMPDGPSTLALAADMRTAGDNVGLGLNLMSDRVGLEKRIYAYANYAYRLRVGWDPEDRLAFGLGLGFIHSGFDNAAAHTQDPESINIENSFLPDARFGVYYSTNTFYAGVGVDNLISQLIFNDNNGSMRIPPVTQYYITGGGIVPLATDILLKPSILVKNANSAVHRAWTTDLNAAVIFAEQFTFGLSYRTALSSGKQLSESLKRPNSIIALAEFVAAGQFRIGYSFDYALNRINNQVGGTHEISLGYSLNKGTQRVRTPRYF